MKFTKIFIPVFMALALITSVTGSVVSAVRSSENIGNKVFRLHILANSDSAADQNIKLMLKNYILENTSDILSGKTLEEAIQNAENNTEKITEMSNDYLKSVGCAQTVKVSVVKEYFKTRVYDDFTLPAGKYNSLKIEIGEGKGHNWWCVIFPSVCLSACSESMSDYLTDDEMELVTSGYSPKFKIVEIYEGIKNR